MVIGIRQRIIEDTDGTSSQSNALDNIEGLTDEQIKEKATAQGPSSEAVNKFTDYSAYFPTRMVGVPSILIPRSDSIHQR